MTPGGEYAKGRGMTGVWARMAALVLALALGLAGCGTGPQGGLHPGETAEIRALIQTYARVHDIPESLLHSVIQRESGYNAAARNGPYYGLM